MSIPKRGSARGCDYQKPPVAAKNMKKKLAGVLGATVPEACQVAFIGQPTTHKQGRRQGRCVVDKDATGDLCVSCVTRLAAAFFRRACWQLQRLVQQRGQQRQLLVFLAEQQQ
ncbi:MAG: hypothetical protein IJT61_05060 [Bacteroidales bacterium]|nr:hypothetical protein [Bacteroidales bacterium]